MRHRRLAAGEPARAHAHHRRARRGGQPARELPDVRIRVHARAHRAGLSATRWRRRDELARSSSLETRRPPSVHVWLAFDGSWPTSRLSRSVLRHCSMHGERDARRAISLRSSTRTQFLADARAATRGVVVLTLPEIAPARLAFRRAASAASPSSRPEFDAGGLRFQRRPHARAGGDGGHARGPGRRGRGDPEARAAPLALAARYFSAVEAAQLEALPATEQPRRFLPPVDTQGSLAQGDGHRNRRWPRQHDVRVRRAPVMCDQVAMPVDDVARWQFWQVQTPANSTCWRSRPAIPGRHSRCRCFAGCRQWT